MGIDEASRSSARSSWVDQRARLLSLAHQLDPAVDLQLKENGFWRSVAALLSLVTLGGISARAFLEDYATTLGPIQAYPRGWSAETVEAVLVHEARHTRQFRWFGFGLHPWFGLPLMALVYLLLPLPLGLAFFRYRLELDADRASWRHNLVRGVHPDEIRLRARAFADRVASGAYGWAWPRRWARRGFSRAAERVIASHNRSRGADA
jgi:hypothetical protein